MTAAPERTPGAVPTELLLRLNEAAVELCREFNVLQDDPDSMPARALCAAAGLRAGLAGLDEAEARLLQLRCAAIFKATYEASAAAGRHRKDAADGEA